MELPQSSDVTWAVTLRSDQSRMPLSSARAHVPFRTASVGKLLLLLEVARGIAAGELSADAPLKRLAEDEGRTVVLVTHDASIAERADRVLTLADGRIVDDRLPRSPARGRHRSS